ncbi:hypothetical protein LO772_16330 [Yinghuangia sp. ASG 101]|uniref:hypothetical protein n=1 Tax=Yinghuangia sp. ASG 101 TaxID=2896848 RepID=UPI001E49D7EC|nr:hypothetical protein [Yinghuangia sp. ASG 101]UGQ14994.1 hypothetical protein LO772_16330 [Yinghuangia sp. ASG 101]
MGTENSHSIVGGLGPATWTPTEGLAYEVAIEGINHVTALYTGLVDKEQRKTSPDAQAVIKWRGQLDHWAQVRRTLTPADPARVQAVTAACKQILDEARSA